MVVDSCTSCSIVGSQQQVKRLNRNVPVNFLSSELCHKALFKVLNQLENGRKTQENVDHCYDQFCDLMYKEMDKSCVVKKVMVKQHYRIKRLYWNDELNKLWVDLRLAEKSFLKCKDQSKRRTVKYEFQYCQSNFDRRLRFFKRRFKRGQALQLEHLQLSNPQQFWREINKLGPQKSKLIPMEILMENGEPSFETDQILKKWETDNSHCVHVIVPHYLMVNS